MITILFACTRNAGRSQMAAGWFNALADPSKARAISAGTQPADRVHPVVVDAMREVGIDVSTARPRRLTPSVAAGAQWLITMGCGDACPIVPGIRRDDWDLDDPADLPLPRVREIRDRIKHLVEMLIDREALAAASPSA